MTDLATLNRLRINAGKTELKSWKASKDKLEEAIATLRAQGFVDVLPGAKLDVKPVTDDPKVAAVLPKDDEPEIRKNPDNRKQSPEAAAADAKDPVITKVRAKLGRGLETEPMARQSREAVRSHNREDRATKMAAMRAAKKAELPKGQVDPKKDPAKADRQQKHIADKKAARADKPAIAPKSKVNDDEITIAAIARKLNIDPKVARAKLRRHEGKISKLHTKGQDRWTFPKSAEKEITAILK